MRRLDGLIGIVAVASFVQHAQSFNKATKRTRQLTNHAAIDADKKTSIKAIVALSKEAIPTSDSARLLSALIVERRSQLCFVFSVSLYIENDLRLMKVVDTETP